MRDFVARNKARVSTRNMAMSRQKKLDKMDVIELAAEKPKPEFSFCSIRSMRPWPFTFRYSSSAFCRRARSTGASFFFSVR